MLAGTRHLHRLHPWNFGTSISWVVWVSLNFLALSSLLSGLMCWNVFPLIDRWCSFLTNVFPLILVCFHDQLLMPNVSSKVADLLDLHPPIKSLLLLPRGRSWGHSTYVRRKLRLKWRRLHPLSLSLSHGDIQPFTSTFLYLTYLLSE